MSTRRLSCVIRALQRFPQMKASMSGFIPGDHRHVSVRIGLKLTPFCKRGISQSPYNQPCHLTSRDIKPHTGVPVLFRCMWLDVLLLFLSADMIKLLESSGWTSRLLASFFFFPQVAAAHKSPNLKISTLTLLYGRDTIFLGRSAYEDR